MSPKDLRRHKAAAKELTIRPLFKPLKRGRLPRPFHKVGGPRFHSTDLVDLSGEYCAVFIWRDGEILTDTAFFAYLLCRTSAGLYPLFELHWHPSHKGIHAKLPCNTEYDYTNRMLPGAPELNLSKHANPDPRSVEGRSTLINEFCNACGITILNPDDAITAPLWN